MADPRGALSDFLLQPLRCIQPLECRIFKWDVVAKGLCK